MRPLFLLALLLLASSCGSQGEAVQTEGEEPANATSNSRNTLGDGSTVPKELIDRFTVREQVWANSCKAEESPLFACNLGNGKRVAVCGMSEWLGRYVYGTNLQDPELELIGGEFAWANYSGGGESQIAFESDEYRYIVFSRMLRADVFANQQDTHIFSDGVVVLRGDEFIDIHICDAADALPIYPAGANAIWTLDADKFTDETIRADSE